VTKKVRANNVAQRKKFDRGGVVDKAYDLLTGKDTRSVMDKPARDDMTDPQYRKEMEQKQALKTTAPEMALVGPARAAQLAYPGGLKENLKELTKRAAAYGSSSGIGGVQGQIIDNVFKNELRGAMSKNDYSSFDEDRKKRRKSKEMKSGGKVKSASSRADGIAQRGKTRGKMR